MNAMAQFAPLALVVGIMMLASPFLRRDRLWARWLVVFFLSALIARYLPWRITETVLPADLTTFQGWWIVFLFAIEIVFLCDMLRQSLIHCKIVNRSAEADQAYARLSARPVESWPSVDVFIPSYNEPLDVLERSIVGALAIDYPNKTVWVLDDGKRDWLREFCEEKGAKYLTRKDGTHAKAGNVNNGLAHSSGDLVCIFDADFVAYRHFLKRVVGFFEDPTIGIVQTPQHFFNKDPMQRNLWIADRWPDEQRLFFDHIAPSVDAWDSMFCCGSCMVMRRKALDAIGGVPTASITEDILTSLEMLREGYRTRYLNEKLSIGLAAESLLAFHTQRERWCQGGIQTLFLKAGPLGPGLSLWQRILLFPIYWVFHIPARLLVIMIPIFYFWFGLQPLENARSWEIFYWQLPVLIGGWATAMWHNGRQAYPIVNEGPAVLVSLRLFPIVVSSLIRPFGRPFKVTPKGSQSGVGNSRTEAIILGVLFVLTIGGFFYNINTDIRIIDNADFLLVGGLWAAINSLTLLVAILICFESPVQRQQERFPTSLRAKITANSDDDPLDMTITDMSLGGARAMCPATGIDRDRFQKGGLIKLDVEELPPLDAKLARVFVNDQKQLVLTLDFTPEPAGEVRDALIRVLYTTGIDNASKPAGSFALWGALLRRIFGRGPVKS
ncbi:MAG: Curdlan synthase [Thalassospira sp.]|nr:Curdlan synthase [Thalassospira sp.]|tara:strand:+ start:3161 stop:5164 length:2004 start_codon:yes stop_codon:yes gene_type:complete